MFIVKGKRAPPRLPHVGDGIDLNQVIFISLYFPSNRPTPLRREQTAVGSRTTGKRAVPTNRGKKPQIPFRSGRGRLPRGAGEISAKRTEGDGSGTAAALPGKYCAAAPRVPGLRPPASGLWPLGHTPVCPVRPVRPQSIKLVNAPFSVSGRPNASLPRAMLFIKNAMLRARLRIV